MKRSIIAGILGVATAATAFGQGHIVMSNYTTAPYNQVYWGSGPNAGQAVQASQGLTFQVFYGAGVQSSYGALTPGATFQIDNTITTGYDPGAGHGPGGYYINVEQLLPTWTAGATFTFGYEVISGGTGQSALWQESANIVPAANSPQQSQSFGLAATPVVVPEPTTMALAGLGAASMLIFRRRK
jgi:hypothetical protein